MNVNLTPVSDTPKTSSSASPSVEAGDETQQSEGFFSKLAALIKGDSGEKKVSESDSAKAEQASDGEESTKALLEQEVSGDEEISIDDGEGAEFGKVVAADTDGAVADELLKSDDSKQKQSAATDLESSAEGKVSVKADGDAEKIISENEELLGRLNEANKALQPKDGNDLPQKSQLVAEGEKSANPLKVEKIGEQALKSAAKSDVEAETNLKSNTIKDGAIPLEQNKLASESVSLKQQVGEEAVVIPENAKRFIEQDGGQEPELASAASKTQPEHVAVVGGVGAAAGLTQLADSKTEMTSPEIELLKQELKAQGLTDKEIEEVVEAAKAEAQAQLAATKGAEVVQPLKATAEKPVQAKATQVLQAASDATSDSVVEPTVAAGVVAGVAAIPWAVSSTETGAEELQIQLDAKPKAQQAHLAQSVQQALHSSSAATMSAAQNNLQATQQASAMPLPNELAASQLQQAVANPAVSEQAMLKAVMGAKAAGTLGKLAAAEGKQGQGHEAGFAQQLSQAAGQQGLTVQNQLRAEQAAAQAPMQLNREIAGEQVAERVQMMMSKNLKNIDIRLDPPELGRLQIRMNMTGDGATVHFTVANQQARDVIEQSMPRLREMLAQQGVQLGDSSVQQQSSGQQQNRYAAGNGQGTGQGDGNQAFLGEENLEPDVNLDLNVATKRDGISYYA
ncbi:flagellar hook-length control protein FliK [Vibrio coralliilyticus]|uniref:Flagellar hook-length control protein FliK n=1 Tax=Vibrio coralliilyticus TaxID=190893 RepID=A0A837G649_9VIBR|nr:flagellar hook-length control protein FliK [Vibrio coralliilyticus]KJY67324.1 flagellar hook-length control protein FliK [Vibrio coralliilyticus]QOU30313.1 flagellar hook-length control protein FliK [Vibrio coralliilyticus]